MKLTITVQDQQQAKEYCRPGECLVATMLKRRGHKEVKASGLNVFTASKQFNIADSLDVPGLYGESFTRVKKSAIGKKIELVEV